jgi:hypothetical protein
MDVVYCKSKWEVPDLSLEAFVRRATRDRFSGTELALQTLSEPPDEIAALHRENGLALIAQVFTEGESPDDHVRSLERQVEQACRCAPVLINAHAGRDTFTFAQNVRLFQRLLALADEVGVPIRVETHRRRPTYSAPATRRYLEALPGLTLTADFSHWMVVHESDLTDQEATVQLAVERSRHVHARVGYEEGPQVPDPRAPEWEAHVRRHVALWQRIVDVHRAAGAETLTITPEFGPPNYMHTLPFKNDPVADAWDVNVYMRDLLETVLDLKRI